MGCCLTSWFSKKQTALAISTTEAEYVSARKACQQVLWMKQALVVYDVKLDDIPVLCDNKGAIDLSKNPILHSRTKHIEIRHHFLRDNVQKGSNSIEKFPAVKGWMVEDLDNYHLKELRCSTQCHTLRRCRDARGGMGKRFEKKILSMRRYVADPDNAYPKRSITKLILKGAVIFDVVSYQFRCALNYSKLVRKL
ncbi:hypothetical protein Tco_1360341 [Tanacetum coccineum]